MRTRGVSIFIFFSKTKTHNPINITITKKPIKTIKIMKYPIDELTNKCITNEITAKRIHEESKTMLVDALGVAKEMRGRLTGETTYRTDISDEDCYLTTSVYGYGTKVLSVDVVRVAEGNIDVSLLIEKEANWDETAERGTFLVKRHANDLRVSDYTPVVRAILASIETMQEEWRAKQDNDEWDAMTPRWGNK